MNVQKNHTAQPAHERVTRAGRTWLSPLHTWLADPNLALIADPHEHGRLRWFLYCTQDGKPQWGSTNFHVFTSDDLVSWKDGGTILDLADVPWARGPLHGGGGAWAPTILCWHSKYFLYFVADSQVGVAFSDSPYGPFEARKSPLVGADDHWLGMPIDPSIVRVSADDGSSSQQHESLNPAIDAYPQPATDWLIWGNGTATFCPLSKDRLELAYGAMHHRVSGWTPKNFREAMWIFERNGIFYASWSVDDTREPTYHIDYGTSRSLDGPWTYRGTLVEGNASAGIVGTGHHSIVHVPSTRIWIIAYHCFDAATGDGTHRQVRFARLHFRADGSLEPVDVSAPSTRYLLR